jgi:plasmid stabilization system protein ParE
MSKTSIKIVWDNKAKEDLKVIYKFNKKTISLEFALKIRKQIYQKVGEIIFLKQWQEDELLGAPYRRIIIGNYKVVYKIKNKSLLYILMVFDTRQDPSKYKV